MRSLLVILLCSISLLLFDSCKDSCKDINCFNGGVCIEGDCDCPDGFVGANCESDLCEGIECVNGGICVSGLCDCPDGFSGDHCEIDTACEYVDCANNAACHLGICDCPEGFSGSNCEIDTACETVACLNGGTCYLGSCNCPEGFSGANCEIDLVCEYLECFNGGSCINGSCDCPDGFGGINCEIDLACENVDCLNDGTCSEGICDCPPEFGGDDCGILTIGLYLGNWQADEECEGTGGLFFVDYSATIQSGSSLGDLIVTNFGDYDDNQIFEAEADGYNFTLPLNIVGGYGYPYTTFDGFGILSEDGLTMEVEYEIISQGFFYTRTCTGTWTKQ